VLVGYKAVLQSNHNPTNTLYDAKRFIGKQFTADELKSEASHYPFKVDSVIFCALELQFYFLIMLRCISVISNSRASAMLPETGMRDGKKL